MTKDGYDKKMKEIATLKALSVPAFLLPSPRLAIRATFRRIPSMMPRRKRKVCLK